MDKELASLSERHNLRPIDLYFYDGTQLVYEINQVIVFPEFCLVAYKCSMDEDSPR